MEFTGHFPSVSRSTRLKSEENEIADHFEAGLCDIAALWQTNSCLNYSFFETGCFSTRLYRCQNCKFKPLCGGWPRLDVGSSESFLISRPEAVLLLPAGSLSR
jgi:hypothetical protein